MTIRRVSDHGFASVRLVACTLNLSGWGHCGGGKTTDRFDELTPLELWAARGIAPEAIVATAARGGSLDLTSAGVSRLLCPYSQYAAYSDGSPAAATSEQCLAQ